MRRRSNRLSAGRTLILSVAVTALVGISCGPSARVREEVAEHRQASGAGAAPAAAGQPGPGDPPAAGSGGTSASTAAETAGGGDHPDAEKGPVTTGAAGEPQAAGGAGAAAGHGGATDRSDGTPATGGATDVGVTADTIRIGSTFFNGGFLDKYSQASEQAVRAYVKFVNDQGGVHGRTIELVTCDTQGTVNGTQGCVKKLLDQDEVFMLGPSLDFNMGTVVPLVTKRQVPWVGTAGLEDPEFDSPYLFPTTLQGGHVGGLMATFAAEQLGAGSIGVSYLKNGAGPSCLGSVRRLAEPLGYTVRGEASNGDTESDLGGQVTKIRQQDPDVIVFCNDPVNTIKFVQAADRQNYAPPEGWIGGWVAADDVPQAIGPAAVGMYGFSPFDFYRGDTARMQQFRAIVQNYYPNVILHSYMQANYVGAEVMVRALAETGPDLTREGVAQALRAMTSYDTGMGLVLDLSPSGEGTPSGIFLQADEQLRWHPFGDRLGLR